MKMKSETDLDRLEMKRLIAGSYAISRRHFAIQEFEGAPIRIFQSFREFHQSLSKALRSKDMKALVRTAYGVNRMRELSSRDSIEQFDQLLMASAELICDYHMRDEI